MLILVKKCKEDVMARAPLHESQRALNAGISLPPELIQALSKEAFGLGKSKSALAQEIIRQHFQRLKRNAARRTATSQPGGAQ